jgi:tetratricopeptide (TPR) repeat protein
VAYQSLLTSTRHQVHQQVAQVFETLCAETALTQPELLAHHYTEAGCPEPAVAYWQKAGQRAVECLAYAEAITHLSKGLEMLQTLPDTPAHRQQALDVQLALGPALIVTQGPASPAVEQVYARTWELCQQAHDTALLLEAHHALWATLFWSGEFAAAPAHLEQGRALYDPQQHHTHALLYGGHDPGVRCLSHGAWFLWVLGYPDQALQSMRQALTLARAWRTPIVWRQPCALQQCCINSARSHTPRTSGQRR